MHQTVTKSFLAQSFFSTTLLYAGLYTLAYKFNVSKTLIIPGERIWFEIVVGEFQEADDSNRSRRLDDDGRACQIVWILYLFVLRAPSSINYSKWPSALLKHPKSRAYLLQVRMEEVLIKI